MKYIKTLDKYLKENRDIIKNNALDILSDNDQNQSPETKDILDKLSDVKTTENIVVTRFSPSPTGKLHIGGIKTCLYSYLFAKKHNGKFILRIEDTDSKRFDPEAEKYIKDALDWIGIEPDESPWKGGPNGPYRQTERDYSVEVNMLLENGSGYYAFDTSNELDTIRKNNTNFSYNFKTRMNMRNSLSLSKDEVDSLLKNKTPYVIRFKVPENREISFDDIIRGTIKVNTNEMDDKVIMKSDGVPSYHLANTSDDYNMGVTHVIRGEEWIPSTPIHILIYESLGRKCPKFAHLPLILNPDGKGKLSKRSALKYGFPVVPFGGESLDDKGNKVKYMGFKDENYEPDALLNFLVLLGWTPSDQKELMTMADMISNFDLHKVSKAGARFDIEKAKWFNQQYINQFRDNDDLLKHINTGDTHEYSPENLSKIIDICKKRSTFVKDMQPVSDIFFKPIILSDKDKSSIVPEFKTVFTKFITDIDNIEWKADIIKSKIYDICEENKIKMGKIMPNLRLVLTGGVPGPDLVSTAEILGQDETRKRIQSAL